MSSINDSTLYKRLFTTKTGEVVIGHPPNLVLILAIVAAALYCVVPGILKSVTILIAYGGFFTWSWNEFTQGVNLFRRITGFLALAATIAAALFFARAFVVF